MHNRLKVALNSRYRSFNKFQEDENSFIELCRDVQGRLPFKNFTRCTQRENISNSAIIFSFFYRKLTISRRISYPINPSPLLLVVFMAYHFLFCS